MIGTAQPFCQNEQTMYESSHRLHDIEILLNITRFSSRVKAEDKDSAWTTGGRSLLPPTRHGELIMIGLLPTPLAQFEDLDSVDKSWPVASGFKVWKVETLRPDNGSQTGTQDLAADHKAFFDTNMRFDWELCEND